MTTPPKIIELSELDSATSFGSAGDLLNPDGTLMVPSLSQVPIYMDDVTAMTVRQIIDAALATGFLPLIMDGKEIVQIKLVGRLSASFVVGKGVQFFLEDGTATVPVHMRLTLYGQEVSEIHPAIYATIIGAMVITDGKLMLGARLCRTVDPSAFPEHMLSVMRSFLKNIVFHGSSVATVTSPSRPIGEEGPLEPRPSLTNSPTRDLGVPTSVCYPVGSTLDEPFSKAVMLVLNCLQSRNQDHLGVHMQELADSLHVRPITLKPYLCDLLIAKAITNEIDVNYFKPV